MKKAKIIKQPYAIDLQYIIRYYFDHMNVYSYASNKGNRWNKNAYLSVCVEDRGVKLPALKGTASISLLDAFEHFFLKRDLMVLVYNKFHNRKDISLYRVRCDIEGWFKT